MTLAPGRVVDQYQLEQTINRGTRSTVFAAVDLTTQQRVAFKALNDDYANDAIARQHVVNQVQVTAQIGQHPNILTVHSWGQVGASMYLVTDLVEGISLRQLLDRQPPDAPLPLPTALQILRNIADAVDHAHQRGVVHRAIEAPNVMVRGSDSDVAAFLMNFGSATTTVADGRSGNRPSDQHSLALLAFELLTGQPAPGAAGDEAVVVTPRSLRPELPQGIDAAFARAVARQPSDRYPSCRAFVTAVESVLPSTRMPSHLSANAGAAPTPTKRPPLSANYSATDEPDERRRRLLPILLGLGATLALVAVLLIWRGSGDGTAGSTTLAATVAPVATVAPSTSSTSTTSTTSTSTSAPATTTTTVAATTTTTVAPATTAAIGPNGRVVGSGLTDPSTPDEQFVAALAAGGSADAVVTPGTPADIYQRWARVVGVGDGGTPTVTANGYRLVIDTTRELRDVTIGADGTVESFLDCVGDACQELASVVELSPPAGASTRGSLVSQSGRIRATLLATMLNTPGRPALVFELVSTDPVTGVADAQNISAFDPETGIVVVTHSDFPDPGTRTYLTLTTASGQIDDIVIAYGDESAAP